MKENISNPFGAGRCSFPNGSFLQVAALSEQYDGCNMAFHVDAVQRLMNLGVRILLKNVNFLSNEAGPDLRSSRRRSLCEGDRTI